MLVMVWLHTCTDSLAGTVLPGWNEFTIFHHKLNGDISNNQVTKSSNFPEPGRSNLWRRLW